MCKEGHSSGMVTLQGPAVQKVEGFKYFGPTVRRNKEMCATGGRFQL